MIDFGDFGLIFHTILILKIRSLRYSSHLNSRENRPLFHFKFKLKITLHLDFTVKAKVFPVVCNKFLLSYFIPRK